MVLLDLTNERGREKELRASFGSYANPPPFPRWRKLLLSSPTLSDPTGTNVGVSLLAPQSSARHRWRIRQDWIWNQRHLGILPSVKRAYSEIRSAIERGGIKIGKEIGVGSHSFFFAWCPTIITQVFNPLYSFLIEFQGFVRADGSQNGSGGTAAAAAARATAASAERCHAALDVGRRCRGRFNRLSSQSDQFVVTAVVDLLFIGAGRQSHPHEATDADWSPRPLSDEGEPSDRIGQHRRPAALFEAATRLPGNALRLQRQRHSRIGRPGLCRCRFLRQVRRLTDRYFLAILFNTSPVIMFN